MYAKLSHQNHWFNIAEDAPLGVTPIEFYGGASQGENCYFDMIDFDHNPHIPIMQDGYIHIVPEPDYAMAVEKIRASPGDTNQTVRVVGRWNQEIAGYFITLIINSDILSLDHSTNLEGCVGEGAEQFSFDLMGNCIRIRLIYTWNLTSGNGIPPGKGTLINLVFNIAEDAPLGVTPIEFYGGASQGENCYFDMIDFDHNPHIPIMQDGYIHIVSE